MFHLDCHFLAWQTMTSYLVSSNCHQWQSTQSALPSALILVMLNDHVDINDNISNNLPLCHWWQHTLKTPPFDVLLEFSPFDINGKELNNSPSRCTSSWPKCSGLLHFFDWKWISFIHSTILNQLVILFFIFLIYKL